MAEILTINPSNRPKRRTGKRRTAAQKAATRKLVALNRRQKGAGRKRKSNPISRRRVRYPVAARPRKKRRMSNPSVRGILRTTVQPAVIGATGALVLDMAWGTLPIPENLKQGYLRHVVKGAGAIGLGMLAGVVTTRSNAEQLARGAMTVVVHGAMRETAQRFMPQVPLDGLAFYNAGYPAGVGEYVNGMSEYVSDGGSPNPYLAADTLTKPFAGPSLAETARVDCLESEHNMGSWY